MTLRPATNSSAPRSAASDRRLPAGTGEAALASVQWPATLTLATITCALAPAYVVRFRVGQLPTTLLEIALLTTAVVFALECLRAGVRPAWRSPLTVPAVLFLVAGALSVAASPGRVAALGLYRAYFLEPILFALILTTAVRSWRTALLVVGGLCAGAVGLALPNLRMELQLLAHHSFNATWMPSVAVYTSQNAVSLYLDPLVAVAAALAVHGRSRLVFWLAIAFLLVALPAEALSLSRAGWAALLVAGLGLVLTLRIRWPLLGVGLAGALALVLSGRALQLFDTVKGNTLDGRIEAWQATLALLRHRPILGAGLTGYPELIRPFWRHYDPLWALHPHDIVLNFWVETGILGLIAFGAIVAVTAVLAWRGWRLGAPGWRALHLGILLALVTVVVHGLVDVPYFKNDLSLEFWALVALAVVGARGLPALSARVRAAGVNEALGNAAG